MSRLDRAWLPHVVLALLMAAMGAWLLHWANLNHSWSNDEELYRHFAHGVARDFPWSIFHLEPSYGRGIQRLHLLLLALPMTTFKNPLAFQLGHLLFVGAYVSAALPAWLIARGCGLDPWRALVPAVLAVLTPWAVMSTSFLTEPVGYGVFAWALWAMWRAVTRPSIGNDLLALALVGLAVVTRTGFLLLVPILPLVAVLQAWRFGSFRRQPLAIGAGIFGVLVLVASWAGVGSLERLTGQYATSLPPLDEMLLKMRTFASRVDGGLGFLTFGVALAWLVPRALRPRDEAQHAFAWLALLSSGAVLMSLVSGDQDERYVMFLAVPLVIAAAVAVFRAELTPVWTALGGAAAVALYLSPGWHVYAQNDFSYRGIPVEAFMSRVVLERIGDSRVLGALLVAAGMAVVVALSARGAWRRFLPLALIPAALLQVGATQYSVTRHVRSVGAADGPSIRARSWVDQHVPDREPVGVYAVSAGLSPDYYPIWRDVQFWNTTMRSVVKVNSSFSAPQSTSVPYPHSTFDVQAGLDTGTGRVTNQLRTEFPRYLVIPQPPLSVALAWDVVAQASYLPAALVKVRLPLQARTTVAGLGLDGRIKEDTPVELTVYRAGVPDARCAYIDVIALPEKSVGYRVGDRRGKLAAQARRRVFLPLRGRPVERFTLTGSAGLQVGNFDTLPEACPKS